MADKTLTPTAPAKDPVAEQNKEIVRNYLQKAWQEGDWTAAEAVVAEDVIFHDMVREGKLPTGREGLRQAMSLIRTGIPDFVMDVQEMVADRDLVVIRWSATGTHAGVFNGVPATYRVVTLHAMSMVRMRDGMIVEGWQEADQLGAGRAMGIVPKSDMPRPIAALVAFGIRTRDRLASKR